MVEHHPPLAVGQPTVRVERTDELLLQPHAWWTTLRLLPLEQAQAAIVELTDAGLAGTARLLVLACTVQERTDRQCWTEEKGSWVV